MSTMYFLACKKHKEYVYITDNKGSAFDAPAVREFITDHKTGSRDCRVTLLSEYQLENLEYGEYDWKMYATDDEGKVYKE